MAIRSRENLIGAWAFLAGVVLAVLAGILATTALGDKASLNQTLFGFLAVLGLVVGYFVSDKNVQTYLIASVSVVIVSFAGLQGGVLSSAILGFVNVSKIITNVLGALLFLFIPSTIIVALKTVFSIAAN